MRKKIAFFVIFSFAALLLPANDIFTAPLPEDCRTLRMDFTVSRMDLYASLDVKLLGREADNFRNISLYRGENERNAGYQGTFLRISEKTPQWIYYETIPGEIVVNSTYRLELTFDPGRDCRVKLLVKTGDTYKVLHDDRFDGENKDRFSKLEIFMRKGNNSLQAANGVLHAVCRYSNFVLDTRISSLEINGKSILK